MAKHSEAEKAKLAIVVVFDACHPLINLERLADDVDVILSDTVQIAEFLLEIRPVNEFKSGKVQLPLRRAIFNGGKLRFVC